MGLWFIWELFLGMVQEIDIILFFWNDYPVSLTPVTQVTLRYHFLDFSKYLGLFLDFLFHSIGLSVFLGVGIKVLILEAMSCVLT